MPEKRIEPAYLNHSWYCNDRATPLPVFRQRTDSEPLSVARGLSLWYVTASALLRLRSLNRFESTDRELIRIKFGMGRHASANAHMPGP